MDSLAGLGKNSLIREKRNSIWKMGCFYFENNLRTNELFTAINMRITLLSVCLKEK